MDWLQFIASLVNSFVWPIAIVVLLIHFRKEIESLLPKVHKFKAGKFEVEFEKELKEIRENLPEEVPLKLTTDLEQKTEELKTYSGEEGRAAIIAAWFGVEAAVRQAALQRSGTSPPINVSSPIRAIDMLANQGDILNTDLATFHSLRGLRNQAAHLPEFSPDQQTVARYVELAGWLEARLRRLANPDL